MDPRTRSLLLGFAGGAAAVLALPVITPLLNEVVRPVSKALLRGSLFGFDYLRTHAAKLSEAVEDLVAEVSAEVKTELDRRAKEGAVGAALVSSQRENDVGPSAKGSVAPGAKSVS